MRGLHRELGVSIEDLQQLNPGMTCPNLDASREYCIFGTVNDKPEPQPQPTTTFKTSTTRAPPTTTKAPVQSNQPQMPGIAKDCDTFHKVASGDQCDTIAKQYGISQSQLREWNSEINNECTNIWLDYYVCVHVPGATTGAPEPTQAPPSGPQPQMPGIVDNCKAFHKVVSGDSCWSIYTAAGISFGQLREWNTYIDAGCTNLWASYYICTGV
ncbi:uncharacterized protein PG998_015097 [Apiospora kogelbergensis]|uniref:uncharacterized protein n=1 Tax=Apiospora kogelbergensis TaxID=1337665 RepID=UPI00312FA55F